MPEPDDSVPPDSSGLSDGSLLRRFQGGEADAATEIYVRYAKRLHALARKQTGADLARRFDAEDIVQSVFRTFFRRAAAGYYEVPAGEELWRLLLVLSLHKVRDRAVYHRAQKRDVGKTLPLEAYDGSRDDSSLDDRLAYDSLRLVVNDLIHDLPEANRRIIELRIDGHGIDGIVSKVGRSKRTVERTLQNFRQRLTELIQAEASERDANDTI